MDYYILKLYAEVPLNYIKKNQSVDTGSHYINYDFTKSSIILVIFDMPVLNLYLFYCTCSLQKAYEHHFSNWIAFTEDLEKVSNKVNRK